MDDFLLTLGEEPLPWEWRFGQEVPGGWKTPDSWRARWAAMGCRIWGHQDVGEVHCGSRKDSKAITQISRTQQGTSQVSQFSS